MQNKLFIAIRMGKIGVISVLQDGQVLQELDEHLCRFKKLELHPIQFREITSIIMYHALLMNRIPKYLISQTNEFAETIQLPLQGGSIKPILDEWDGESYAKILSQITQIPLENIVPHPGKVWTWLQDEKGKLLFMDINKET